MGGVVHLELGSEGRGVHRQSSSRTRAHIRQAIKRYRRDLALMLGERTPADRNVDDIAILERFQSNPDQTGLINEWVLRIKTLEAMLELLREERLAAEAEPEA